MVQDRAIVTTYVIYRSAAFSLTIKCSPSRSCCCYSTFIDGFL